MLICQDDAGGQPCTMRTLQSEQERSLTPLLTRVGPARRDAVVLRAGVCVIRPDRTVSGGCTAAWASGGTSAAGDERQRTRSWPAHRVLYDVYGGDWTLTSLFIGLSTVLDADTFCTLKYAEQRLQLRETWR